MIIRANSHFKVKEFDKILIIIGRPKPFPFNTLFFQPALPIPFGNHWDFAPEISYNLKDGHINSLTLAIGVGKRF